MSEYERPRAVLQHVRDSPKINVFFAVSHRKVYGPFFFPEQTVNSARYLGMLQIWLMPQLKEQQDDFVFPKDPAPPHWHTDVRDYLDEILPHRWIGRATADNIALAFWPPRSPDLTPCDFFLWGFVKDSIFVTPVPLNLDDLKQRIR
ncbi:hypothetical protein C0J52_15767 [Blattella germanica]|nr:hypothetical protein C0J52_15767 [Blattella germanica]